MSRPDETREEALKRLAESASALDARTTRQVADHSGHAAASSQAWRILADLFGGVLVGLAGGVVFDRFADTAPWGIIVGVLGGFGVSIWMARRTANRLMAQARSENEAAPAAVPFDDKDED
jgi:ATP synthase protein I